ncbi:MAG: type transport system ATP-binding protein [Chloroflexota bacterium]|jgi:ABC-2 type transport system ATP-binding protein|nr:type transport system ATP-binding protein [Chloroflexota bacterium]
MAVLEPIAEAPAVEVVNLSKTFRRAEKGAHWWTRASSQKYALEDVSLVIARNQVTGIIGANGSGKSTLIRVLSTLLLPDRGTARVFGHDVVSQTAVVQRLINRVSVEASFFKEMSPWENLSYAGRLYGTEGSGRRMRASDVLERLGLPLDTMDRPMKHLSRGQQQKVAIARSLLTSPTLLLMDEPTTGLDPRSKREVQALVAMVHAEGDATVLICTHDLQEAEALCERVVIMDGGRVLADGTPAELRAAHGPDATLEDVFMKVSGKELLTLEDEEGAA